MADSENTTPLPRGLERAVGARFRFHPIIRDCHREHEQAPIEPSFTAAQAIALILDRAEAVGRTVAGDEIMMMVLKPGEIDALAAIGAGDEELEDSDPPEDGDPCEDDDPAGGNVEDEGEGLQENDLGLVAVSPFDRLGDKIVPLHRQPPEQIRIQVATLPRQVAGIRSVRGTRERLRMTSALFTKSAPREAGQ